MYDLLLFITYLILFMSAFILSVLYWYATFKAFMNPILKATAILMSTVAFDSLYFFLSLDFPTVLLDKSLILIPKLLLIYGILNMIKVSFEMR